MIGVMRAWHQGFRIAIINLSRRVWKLDETYACFTSTYISIFPKCPPFIFRFHKKYSMTTIGCFYLFLCIHLVHSAFFYVTLCELIIEDPYIEYLISLHNLSCILLLLWRMNHLTLCSSSNHLWYPLLVLYCKAHVSFITFNDR